MKTAVVIDSGSNYYNESVNMDGLFAIPLQIIHGDESFLETVTISIDEVNDLLSKNEMLQTSLPVLGQIEELFQDIKKQGYDKILAIPITAGISGTIDAFYAAAKFVEIDIEVIDCYTTAWIELELGIAARTLLDAGHSIETIKERFQESIQHSDTFIIPDNLDHLARGGRLSPLAAKLGGFLKIKPILHLNESTKGVIDPFDKVRTMSKAIDTVIETMKNEGVGQGYLIVIANVVAPELAESTLLKMKEAFPEAVFVNEKLVPTVSVHVGVGSIAMQYMKLPNLT